MDLLKNLEIKITAILQQLKDQFSGIRGGRPNSKLVEEIAIDYFGQKFAIKQIGSINIIPPREIQISVWDKNTASLVLKAIESSNLNASAVLEGNLIRINLPALSGERRQELAKLAKKETEEAKIKARLIRDEVNKEISGQFESKKISENEKFKLKEKVQKRIDETNAEIDKILEAKTKEIEE